MMDAGLNVAVVVEVEVEVVATEREWETLDVFHGMAMD